MRVLIINSYAGSITLGAHALGCNIIASMEDVNYALDVQKANFPKLNYYEYQHQWPKLDLRDTVVAAHPPCSAFSVQNISPNTRGIDSEAFACTRKILDYSVKNKALGIVIESVIGALQGAWQVHQHYADTYGYNIYRILQNGSMMSAQWRNRFWVVYIRKNAIKDNILKLRLNPIFQSVNDVILGYEKGPEIFSLDKQLNTFKNYLTDIRPCDMTPWAKPLTDKDMSYLFDTQDPHHPTTGVGHILWKYKFKDRDQTAVTWRYVTTFSSSQMCYLNPEGLSGVLLGSSWWYINGENLNETGYKRIMGFPPNYIFPERERKKIRQLMSKGVIPSVAEWIIGQVGVNLGMIKRGVNRFDKNNDPYEIEVKSNRIADFRFDKKDWGQHRPIIKEFKDE